MMRLYNSHGQSEGYLYIKDCDDPKYITIINITPRTGIKKISLLHEGVEWTENLGLYPGETVIAQIEGEGLLKAKFIIEDPADGSSDSALRRESYAFYTLNVPMNLLKKRVSFFNYSENTGLTFQIKEYQLPIPLDFIQLNYGYIDSTISSLKSLVLYEHSLTDITFKFIPGRIVKDPHKLYGKQYLKVAVTLSNNKGQMLEMRTFHNVMAFFGDNSHPSNFYDRIDC